MAGKKKYVDVDIFLYWLCGHPVHGERARLWIRQMESPEGGEFITSVLTIYELMVLLANLKGFSFKERPFISSVLDAIFSLSNLEIVPLSRGDCKKALELMTMHDLDYEDSLHLAVALRSGATTIVSSDRDFDRTPIRRIF